MPQADLHILGIETSCDESAAAVVIRKHDAARGKAGVICSNIVRSQLEEHQAFGGVVPEIAARAHVDVLDGLIKAAMSDAKLGWRELDGVAVTAGPGLIGGLMVGVMTAKAIALVQGLPLLGINHLEAHALTPGLTSGQRPPYLLLLVSGGHTQTVNVHDVGRYSRLGTTVDDALGEAFDKTAKLLGLDYPGGPAVEHAAQAGDPRRFSFPRPMKGRAEPHFSFSGLKTAVRQQAQKLEPLTDQDIADLCASFQAAVVDSVSERVLRAMQIYGAQGEAAELIGAKTLVVAGGVAANRSLRAGLDQVCAREGFVLQVPPVHLCTDNAAMIAWAGAERFARGEQSTLDFSARARWPLDPEAAPAIGAGIKA